MSWLSASVLVECQRIRDNAVLQESELLRIYWYDAPPATRVLKNPLNGRQTNLGQTELHRWATSLQDTLEMQPDFALRLGEVSVSPMWTIREQVLQDIANGKKVLAADDIKPSIEQKGVDLRIGLDIARLALRQFVSTIVVATGDSDMIPAFKFARREGVRVYLDLLGSLHVKRDLKAHVDLIL
jgi:uncharacterized LabA/DUF88 family protein